MLGAAERIDSSRPRELLVPSFAAFRCPKSLSAFKRCRTDARFPTTRFCEKRRYSSAKRMALVSPAEVATLRFKRSES